MGMRRVGALVLAGVLATGLAACGDDDDSGGGIALEDINDDASGSGSTAEDDEGDSGDLGDLADFSSEECQNLIGALSGGFGGGLVGDDAEFNFGALAEVFDELADDFPEIDDELGVLADAYREFEDALGDDPDFSDPEIFTSPEFAEATAAISTPEVEAASDAVSTFFDDTCGAG